MVGAQVDYYIRKFPEWAGGPPEADLLKGGPPDADLLGRGVHPEGASFP